MKIPKPVPAAPPSASAWMIVAVLSLAANLALGAWIWRRPKSAPPPPVPAVAPVAESWRPELTAYAALGSFMAENNRVSELGWTPAQFAAFLAGFRSSYEGRGVPLDEPAQKLRDEMSRRVRELVAVEQPDPAAEYFRFLREKEKVQQTPSGLHYRITEPGSGEPARATDTVVISYAAGLPEGKSLPALSRVRVRVAVRDLLPGLAEGVQLLRVGGKALVYLPPALSFRESEWPPQLPAGTPLVFFVEMHDIVAGE